MQLSEVHTALVTPGCGVNVADIVEIGVGEPEIVGVNTADGDATMLGVGTIVAEIVAVGVMEDSGDGLVDTDGSGEIDTSISSSGGVVRVQ